MADEELRYEDARHIDHQQLRDELEQEFEGRDPGARTVEINNQRYRLYTLKEYLASPNQPTTRWEVFELIALIDARRRYERRTARLWRATARALAWLGFGVTVPPAPKYIKIPVGRIERRSG